MHFILVYLCTSVSPSWDLPDPCLDLTQNSCHKSSGVNIAIWGASTVATYAQRGRKEGERDRRFRPTKNGHSTQLFLSLTCRHWLNRCNAGHMDFTHSGVLISLSVFSRSKKYFVKPPPQPRRRRKKERKKNQFYIWVNKRIHIEISVHKHTHTCRYTHR